VANTLKLSRQGAVGFIDWLGRNGSMSRERLRLANAQGVEVVQTLIGSRQNVEVIEILPRILSRRDPNILMSVVIRATQPFRPNYNSTKVSFAYFGFYSRSDPGKRKT
jgi:hypothetical protein